MNDEYLPNMHPAILRSNRPLSARAGARGPSMAPGGIDPQGLGNAGAASMPEEDMRQSNPYYLDFGGPRTSLESGNTAFNRSVYRRFGRAINPAELLARTNPTNANVTMAPQAPAVVAPINEMRETVGRLRIGYDSSTREDPGSRKRYGGSEVQNKLQYDHLIKKAHEANRLEELQRARRLRLRAANHERIAAMAEVAPEHVASELTRSPGLEDVSGRPSVGGLPPAPLVIGIIAAVTFMLFIPAIMDARKK